MLCRSRYGTDFDNSEIASPVFFRSEQRVLRALCRQVAQSRCSPQSRYQLHTWMEPYTGRLITVPLFLVFLWVQDPRNMKLVTIRRGMAWEMVGSQQP